MADAKKNILTYAGLQELEAELEDLKVNKRKEVAQKIKEAREPVSYTHLDVYKRQTICLVDMYFSRFKITPL